MTRSARFLSSALAASALLLLWSSSSVTVAALQESAPQTRESEEHNAHEAFEEAMHQAGSAWRNLRQSNFNADSRQSDLSHIQSLQEALLTAKANVNGVEMSPRAQEEFGDDQQAYLTAMRKNVLDVLAATMLLEQAVLEGNTDAAQDAFQQVAQQQRQAHAMFRPGRDNVGPRNDNQGGNGGGNRGQENNGGERPRTRN